MSDLKTERRLPPAIKGTVYQCFIEAISEEILALRKEMNRVKTGLFNVNEMSYEQLLGISRTFKVPFSALVKDDIEFLKQEIKSIGFKLFYKGTPFLYKSFFPTVDREGEMFIYVFLSAQDLLFRHTLLPYDSARKTDKNLPFKFSSKNDFSGKIAKYLTLDDTLTLDSAPPWKLDVSDAFITSNHIGLEYFIDRIITRKGKEYLMTHEYLLYLNDNMEWGRRCKEVPHIGSQLSLQTDLSGKINKLFPDQEYSVPSLKTNVVAVPDFMSKIVTKYDIAKAKFGISSHSLPSVQNPSIPLPTDLKQAIAEVSIISPEIWEDTRYIGATAEYIGQEIKRINLPSSFDGTKTHFSFTLPLAPIQRGNVCIVIKDTSDNTEVSTIDDKRGVLMSPHMTGTVNYETGECTIDTKFDYQNEVNFQSKDCITPPDVDLWKFEVPVPSPIIKGSFEVTYVYNKKAYQIKDNKNGALESPDGTIAASTIDYNTGKVSIRFLSPVTEDIKVRYKYPVDWKPQAKHRLIASYFFILSTVEITEFGIFNNKDELLAYATFPPLEFSATNFHSNLTILVDKTIT